MKTVSNIHIFITLILFALFLGDNPLENLPNEKEYKKIPKRDRIEYAILQDFESTKDPATNKVPSEKLYDVFEELQRSSSSQPRTNQAISWEERGPTNVAGRTRAILVDQADPTGNTLLAGSVSGGIWKCTNAKMSNPFWYQSNGLMDNLAIATLVQDPNNTNIIYAGTGEGFFNVDAQKGNGIWKSIDGGESWTRLSSTANENFFYTQNIAINPSGYLFASTRNNGLMRSSNGGLNWTKVLGMNYGALTDRANDIYISGDGTLYVTMGIFNKDGIYRSENNGSTWIKLNGGLPTLNYHRIEIDGAISNDNVLYALFQDEQSGSCNGIYKSTNRGDSWSQITLPQAYGMSNFARNQAWYNLSIAVNPADENQLIVGGIDLHRSTNGGQSWTQLSQWAGELNYQYVHADQHEIVYEGAGSSAIFFGNDGGIARSLNINSSNPTIQHINSGYNVTQFYAAAIHPGGTSPQMLAGAQDNGTQKFTGSGSGSTIEVAGGDGSFCHIDQDDPTIQLSNYVFNNYFVSTDGGESFSLRAFNNQGRFANPSAYDNSVKKLYAGSYSGTYFRWNNPAQAGNDTDLVNVSAFSNAELSAVTISPNLQNRAYFGLNNGDVVLVDDVNTGSSKNGQVILNGSASTVSCIEVEQGNEDHILVSYSNYGVISIRETINGGASWTEVEGNLPDIPVRWVVFNPQNSDQALLATELGIWRTDQLNGHNTIWYRETNALSNVRVDMLKFRESDNFLAAASHGRGLFTTNYFVKPEVNFDLQEITISEQSSSGSYGSCNLDDKLISIPVSISALPSNNITFSINVESSSSAEEGKDYVLLTPSLTFSPNGLLQKEVNLKILDEAILEDEELIELQIQGPSIFIGENNNVQIIISDDDHDPLLGGSISAIIGAGGSEEYHFPFSGYYEDERTQILYKAEELLQAGLLAGDIKRLEFYITEKQSDSPFNNFNVRMKLVNMNQLGPAGNSFVNGATQVYSGNINTVNGWNSITLQDPFYWDGSTDLIVDICFDNQSWSDDDKIRTSMTSFLSVQYTCGDGGSGCSFANVGNTSTKRPDLRFELSTNTVLVDVMCSKSSTLIQGDEAHFYDEGKLMASIKNLNGSNIQCMDLSIDRMGNGIDFPSWMNGSGVTEKTFYIDAAIEAPYEISLYFTPAELAEWADPLSLNILKTGGTIESSSGEEYEILDNAELTVETLDNGIIVYRGQFLSFSGFALTDLNEETLAVKIESFEVQKELTSNRIIWEIGDHLKNSKVQLERSYNDLNSFYSLKFHEGNSQYISEYFDHEIQNGITYYRLKFIDVEGFEQFSKIISVRRKNSENQYSLYPNPVSDHLNVVFSNEMAIKFVEIFDRSGQQVLTIQNEVYMNNMLISMDQLPAGIYFVAIHLESGEKHLEKIIKQ